MFFIGGKHSVKNQNFVWELLVWGTSTNTLLEDISKEEDAIKTIANNLLKLNVYFESKMTKYIEEKKTYDSVCIEFISISNQKQGQNIL